MKIESLTSLRFFAALLVVFSHLRFLSTSESPWLREFYRIFCYEGYIGVTFFFILSGFILSYSYLDRLQTGRITKVGFWVARVARIYPLHLLTFVASLPIAIYLLIKSDGSFLTLLPNMLLVQAFFPVPEIYFSANIPSWSLSDEMFFYLLFPLLLFSRTTLLVVISAVIAALQLCLMASVPGQEQQHFWIYVFPVCRLFDFIIGILLFRLYRYLDIESAALKVNSFQVVSLGGLLLFFFAKELVPQSFRYDLYYVLPMSMVILSFACPGGVLSRLLESRALVLLGEASFSLYLIHQLTIRYLNGANTLLLGFAGPAWDFTLAFVILSSSVGLSIFIYKYFEVPSTRFVRELLVSKISSRSA